MEHLLVDLTEDGPALKQQPGHGTGSTLLPTTQQAVHVIDLTSDTPPDFSPETDHQNGIDNAAMLKGEMAVPPVGNKRSLPASLGRPHAKAARLTGQQAQPHRTEKPDVGRQRGRPANNSQPQAKQQATMTPQHKRVMPGQLVGLQDARHPPFPSMTALPVPRLQWIPRNALLQNAIQDQPRAGPTDPQPPSAPAILPPQGAKRAVPNSLLLPKLLPPVISIGPSPSTTGTAPSDSKVELQPASKKQRTEGSKDAAVVDHQAAMRAVLENLALTGDDEIDPPQKSLMISIMRHQRMALAWMVKREMGSTPKGGILADDQGLGKTISTISLIVTNMPDPTTRGKLPKRAALGVSSDSGPGPGSTSRSVTPEPGGEQDQGLLPGGTLVVCPTTVLHQWYREMCEKVNRQTTNFSVHIYHGKDKALSAGQLSRYTVVLTTYGTLGMEAPPSARHGTKGNKKTGSTTNLSGQDDGAMPGSGSGVKVEDIIQQDSKPDLKTEIKSNVKQEMPYDVPSGNSPSPDREDAVGNQSSGGRTAGGASASGGYGGCVEPGGLIRRRGSSAGLGDGGGLLFQVAWHRVVLDEAQSIKNPRTLVSQAVWRLSADHRWCLSGTPIQNSVDDLFSYFKFLRYAPYDDPALFKSLIKDKILANSESGFKLLSVVLQAILLRRTKQTKFNGEPIVNIPPREQHLESCEFTNKQEAQFYAQVQEESRASLEAATEAGGATQYVNMLYSLLKLRQACNHPWLVKGACARALTAGGSGTGGAQIDNGVAPSPLQVAAARKLPAEERARLLELALHPSAQCPSCQDVPEQAMVTRCGHVYCTDCMATQMEGTGTGQSDEFTCSTCSTVIQSVEMYTPGALQAAQGGPGAVQVKRQPQQQGEGNSVWVSSTKVDKLLKLLSEVRRRNGDTAAPAGAAPVTSNVLAVRSKADRALARTFKSLGPAPPRGGATGPLLRDGRRPEKVIVFSQWTGMLDLLEVALKRESYIFRRLDGTMPVATRERAITDFEQKSEVNILLVSLKAAALGLNLTVANHVVLMDLWWNPTIEEQAIDRAHRIGQKRTVHVTRITIKGTVEERILKLQERKRELISAALCEGGSGPTASKLSMEDLRFLFMGVPSDVTGSGDGASQTKAGSGSKAKGT